MPIVTDKSRKWIITIFMSVLIVAFALPSYFGQGPSRRAVPVATVFGENITENEIEQAKNEWSMLRQTELIAGQGLPFTIKLFLPLPTDIQSLMMLSQMGALQQPIQVAQVLEAGISRDPKLYALLKREAARRSITPSMDRVEALLVNQFRLPETTSPQQVASFRQAAFNFLAVEASIQQASMAVKLSRPLVQSSIATQLQSLSLNVVLFDADEFRAKVPPPSETTIQSLYAAHRDQLPNGAVTGEAALSSTNYGFGYRLNDGVRLEYIALSSAELSRAAKASKSAHDWEVEGQRYYLQNKSQFTRILPAPPASTQATTAPIAPASSQPIQQTFAEVGEQILAQLYETKAAQLQTQVERRLSQLLGNDYRQYADAKLKNAAAAPSSVATPVGSFDYLRAIAAKVEKETGVLPEVTSFGDRYLDAASFDKEEIGRATLAESQASRPIPLGAYLLTRAKPFFEAAPSANRQPGLTALEALEPTPVFRMTAQGGGAKPVIIARLLDARSATTLPLEQVQAQVREDAILQAATEAARTEAETFLASASNSSLSDAVTAAKRKVIAAPALRFDPASLPADLFTLSRTSKEVFVKSAFDLLRSDVTPGKARTIVSLPRDRKVAVIEYTCTQPLAPNVEPAVLELQMQYIRQLGAVDEFLLSYLTPDAILQRTQFVDLSGRSKPSSTQPASQNN